MITDRLGICLFAFWSCAEAYVQASLNKFLQSYPVSLSGDTKTVFSSYQTKEKKALLAKQPAICPPGSQCRSLFKRAHTPGRVDYTHPRLPL